MRPRGACVRSGRRATACAIAFFFAALVAAKAADAAVGGGPDARNNDGAGGALAAAAAAGSDPAAEPRSIADLYRDFSDAIVRVAIVTNNAEGVPVRFTCTGFVISPQGRVV